MKKESENMEFTGECFVPEMHGNIELEHLYRYLLASQVVAGKEVLDIASGEGYGSAMLAKLAHKVIGVDISKETISQAKAKYRSRNLKFRVGSCSAIPLDDASVDVVVSFETIEHHDELEAMLQEIKRVLRPGGVLVISSPDKLEYSDKPSYQNEYHVKGLYRDEFEALLNSHFKNHSIYGQRVIYGPAFFCEDGARPIQSYELADEQLNPIAGIPSAVYLVAIASDGEFPILDSGILEQTINETELVQGLVGIVADHDGQITSLTDKTVRRGELALRLDAELKEARAQLLLKTQSHSWRFTLPLREARRWLSSPKQQAKRYARRALHLARRIYQSLPLSYRTKMAHRKFIAKNFPRVLLASGAHPGTIPMLSAKASVTSKEAVREILEQASISSVSTASIEIPASHNPLVTVIIPIYGKIDYTLRCLASISTNPPKVAFEVIVVNDCSPDNSAEMLANVKDIRLIHNEENQGFIRSCNFGADAARGEYLYFLNNDTVVTHGWMDELWRTFQELPGTGLAGSKLIYPDGRLQEAGGIIWQDGSAWNFGRNQDPSQPIFNYAREVDYCSGASIMVPRTLFEELGGFDEHYLPAYCEDSDLALKIRDKGYRVIYQPLSTVIHYEGVTSGTDTSQGTKAYQVENMKKIYERWESRLQIHHPAGMDADNAKDRRATRRVLVLDHSTPTPDQDSGSIDVYNIMALLREMDFQVTFIPEDNFLYMPKYTSALQCIGIEVLYAPYTISVEQHLKEFGERYDLAFLFRPTVVEHHLKTIRKLCPKAKVLFHTVDLHFLRMSREAKLQSNKVKQKAADEMKQRELYLIKNVDIATVVSSQELELLAQYLPQANIRLLPYSRHIEGTKKGFGERLNIVFVGGYQHPPNIDAVQYFVTEIMPLLRQRLPGVCFYAVGSKPPAEIQALASEDVIITGFIEDLTTLLDKMRVSVAPLRYGAGIKGKIGSAMAVGLPVVVTPLAAEGMSLTDGENILVAEGAEQFVNAVVRLYQDESLWNRISHNGLEFAENAWGAEMAWENLAGILRELDFESVRDSRQLALYTPRLSNSCVVKNTKSVSENTIGNADYLRKIQQELTIYEKQVNVHDLPDIFHYWSNKYLVPKLRTFGFNNVNEFYVKYIVSQCKKNKNSTNYVVSIGSGNCDMEVDLVLKILGNKVSNFRLECLDINPDMLMRGKELAREKGIVNYMAFNESDINTWKVEKKYSVCIANQSLHHFVELEILFDKVKKSIHSEGIFLTSDVIGRNGHMRWPEALEVLKGIWSSMPDKYKYNHQLRRLEEEFDNWDCSKEGFEGIRSQDILPLLIENFYFEMFFAHSNNIIVFVDRSFGHNFNVNMKEDIEFIDKVAEMDNSLIEAGVIKPTQLIAVMRTVPVDNTKIYKNMTPEFCVRP